MREERMYNLTIFLMKEHVTSYEQCVKEEIKWRMIPIKEQYGMEGVIVLSKCSVKPPSWKCFLQSYSDSDLKIKDNISNKALMLIKVQDRIMALTFGYGRSFLREESIEKNFGFKTALNMIDPQKIRSINAATVEDMVVHVQKQSSYSAGQEEFSLNPVNDIMMSVMGKAQSGVEANNVSGKDSLIVSVEMSPPELKEKLDLYLKAYSACTYQKKGFGWIDNIREVRDPVLKESLDLVLVDKIEKKDISNILISPSNSLNWEEIRGFAFSGIRKCTDDIENYQTDIQFDDYLSYIKAGAKIYRKLKHDKIYALDNNDNIFSIGSVFSALVAQVEYNDCMYVLCDGRWFKIEENFFKYVKGFVSKIPISDVDLPECECLFDEGKYNEETANDEEFCLMDKKMIGVDGGVRRVEACDIFTKNKQFIHIKNKHASSQLSHLFSQGRVSAECFVSDEEFRRQVYEEVKEKLGEDIFDYRNKPDTNEYEVVFGIITNKIGKIEESLPFFSLVNLMLTIQDLDRMRMKYSVKMILKKAKVQ